MSVSVKRYKTDAPMSNSEIARRLGVTCGERIFSGFYREDEWIGGKADADVFTVTLRRGAEDLHTKAAEFATFIGES